VKAAVFAVIWLQGWYVPFKTMFVYAIWFMVLCSEQFMFALRQCGSSFEQRKVYVALMVKFNGCVSHLCLYIFSSSFIN
jgi:hypothetical protein